MLANSHATLIKGLGHAKLGMNIQLLKAALYIPTISLGVYWYGVEGAAWAYVFNKILEVIIAQYYLKKYINVLLSDLISSMKAPVLATIASLLITSLLYNLGIHYIICAAGLAISYGSIIWLLMKTEINAQYKSIRKFKTKKVAVS